MYQQFSQRDLCKWLLSQKNWVACLNSFCKSGEGAKTFLALAVTLFCEGAAVDVCSQLEQQDVPCLPTVFALTEHSKETGAEILFMMGNSCNFGSIFQKSNAQLSHSHYCCIRWGHSLRRCRVCHWCGSHRSPTSLGGCLQWSSCAPWEKMARRALS